MEHSAVATIERAETRSLEPSDPTTPFPFGLMRCTRGRYPKVTFATSGMHELLSTSSDDPEWTDFIAENVYHMLPAEQRKVFRAYLAQADSSHTPIGIMHDVVRVDGSRITLAGWLSTEPSAEGVMEYRFLYVRAPQHAVRDAREGKMPERVGTAPASGDVYRRADPSYQEFPRAKATELRCVTHGQREIFIRTFGHFDIFVGGKPVFFSNPKEKELLAILVDRYGGTVTAEEAIDRLWEDEPYDDRVISRYRKLLSRLRETLRKHHLEDLVVEGRGVRSIDTKKGVCDYFELMRGNETYIRRFSYCYMSNYSWAEPTLASLTMMFER